MAINSNLSSFLDKVKQGVRPNMFEVEFAFPSGIDAGDGTLATYMCKSAALPASNVGVIEVPFRGRTVKIAGDRTFDNWSTTFITDRDMKIRAQFEKWLELINSHEPNTAQLANPSETDGYTRGIIIRQRDKDASPEGTELRSYKLWYAFPTSVSAVDLAYDSNDQIEEFSVEFQYSYWTVGSNDGTVSGPSGISIS
tara:strand:- start:274 stop:864 length:591 start_codon:yes stop_codon:yes gene_type:complete